MYYDSDSTRKDLIATSKAFDLFCRIGDPIFNTGYYIPHFVDVKISLKRSSSAFSLIAKDKTVAGSRVVVSNDYYKIVLDKVIYHCKKVIPHPDVITLFNGSIRNGILPKIEYEHTEIKTFIIAKGAVSIITPAIFGGVLPSSLLIFMLPTSYLNGSIKHDPFSFKHYNISTLEIIADTEVTTKRSINVDFANKKYLEAYT